MWRGLIFTWRTESIIDCRGIRMPDFKPVSDEDIKFYLQRQQFPEDTYSVTGQFISRTGSAAPMRFVYKQIEGSNELEVTTVIDELLLKSSPKGRDELKATVFGNDGRDWSLVVQKYRNQKPITGQSVSFRDHEWNALLGFLRKLEFIDFSNAYKFRKRGDSILVNNAISTEDQELLDKVKSLGGDERLLLLEQLTSTEALTSEELNIVSGRRAVLNIFREQLYDKNDWKEPDWQSFFQKHPWIFGHGLDYRFLSILRKEGSVSGIDLDGKDAVQADFLMGATDFTVVVEMKTPQTPLIRGADKIRSRTWGMSTDLMDAVSQILIQKAEWQATSRFDSKHDDGGNAITQRAFDPKAILIVGMMSSLDGDDRETKTKKNTFELFRRDSRNIEVVTYDELYERAYYIVNQKLPDSDVHETTPPQPQPQPIPDDIPF